MEQQEYRVDLLAETRHFLALIRHRKILFIVVFVLSAFVCVSGSSQLPQKTYVEAVVRIGSVPLSWWPGAPYVVAPKEIAYVIRGQKTFQELERQLFEKEKIDLDACLHVRWVEETGLVSISVAQLPAPEAVRIANTLADGLVAWGNGRMRELADEGRRKITVLEAERQQALTKMPNVYYPLLVSRYEEMIANQKQRLDDMQKFSVIRPAYVKSVSVGIKRSHILMSLVLAMVFASGAVAVRERFGEMMAKHRKGR